MPTYEYECQACHRRVEAVQGFADAALTTCESCGGDLRKVFSAVGIVFKGSGFYKNDNRKKPASSTASTKSTDSSSASATPASNTPSAPSTPSPASSSSAASD